MTNIWNDMQILVRKTDPVLVVVIVIVVMVFSHFSSESRKEHCDVSLSPMAFPLKLHHQHRHDEVYVFIVRTAFRSDEWENQLIQFSPDDGRDGNVREKNPVIASRTIYTSDGCSVSGRSPRDVRITHVESAESARAIRECKRESNALPAGTTF